MNHSKYVAPQFQKKAFHCPQPQCGVYAHQEWTVAYIGGGGGWWELPFAIARCTACNRYSVWHETKLIFPSALVAPPSHPDMPDAILADYEEARQISAVSPRGAAALLRLAIQKLCIELKQPGKNLNDDIGALVKNGLPTPVQQALDSLRVIGNNAVHPGQIDLKDDAATTTALFQVVNFAVEKLISEPKKIQELYSKVPPGAAAAIQKRDAPKS